MYEKKVLIVTYYWPPSGGSGVQRWLKFVKCLPLSGWTPYVFTPENPSFVQTDESLLMDVPAEAEVIRFPIWEPYRVFFKLTSAGKSKAKSVKPSQIVGKERSLFTKVAAWMRGNFLIPDPKIFWIRPSVSFLDGFLKRHNIQNIITTGPPHSIHLIGLRLKKKNPELNWIVDFRDPWSEWFFLDLFNLTSIVRAIHKKLEQKVLKHANHIVTITPFYVKRFEALSGKKIELLTNGFDEDDFKNVQHKRPEKFTIRHIGIIYEMANPKPFIEALSRLIKEVKEFKKNTQIEFIGEVHASFRKVVEQSPMTEITSFLEPVPHRELVNIYCSSSVLLLNIEGYPNAEGLLPGKIFEYIATGVPVLGIGPVNGDSSAILQESKAGIMFDKTDTDGMVNFLKGQFSNWVNNEDQESNKDILKFSRREITRKLTQLLH